MLSRGLVNRVVFFREEVRMTPPAKIMKTS